MGFFEKFQSLQSRIISGTAKPFAEKYYGLFVSLLIAYIVADLSLLHVRPTMLPTKAPIIKTHQAKQMVIQSLAEYDVITKRNIFNEDGKIAPPFGIDESGGPGEVERPAVPSQLPIQLLGTIVNSNPRFSIATVSLNSKNMSASYKVDEDIENIARVTKIERKKLTFRNLSNNRNEYIEIPDDSSLNFGIQAGAAPAAGSGGFVEQTGKFDFSVKRADFEALTNNMQSVLQQARVEPVFSPDGIGVEGYRFVNIIPGSPFEKLGFKIGDMIKSVNGEDVNSPTKALEMFNLLKSSNFVQMGVEREGREERFNYSLQ